MGKNAILALLCFCGLLLVGCRQEQRIRTVNVRIIVDEDDFYDRSGLEQIKKAVAFSSMELESNFLVKLKITNFGKWPFPAGTTAIDLDEVCSANKKTEKRDGADMVLAYTTKNIYRYIPGVTSGIIIRKEYSGCANKVLGDFAAIRSNEKINLITLHEIYHLFGALHFEGPEASIMHSEIGVSKELDRDNFDIVLKNRLRSFYE